MNKEDKIQEILDVAFLNKNEISTINLRKNKKTLEKISEEDIDFFYNLSIDDKKSIEKKRELLQDFISRSEILTLSFLQFIEEEKKSEIEEEKESEIVIPSKDVEYGLWSFDLWSFNEEEEQIDFEDASFSLTDDSSHFIEEEKESKKVIPLKDDEYSLDYPQVDILTSAGDNKLVSRAEDDSWPSDEEKGEEKANNENYGIDTKGLDIINLGVLPERPPARKNRNEVPNTGKNGVRNNNRIAI